MIRYRVAFHKDHRDTIHGQTVHARSDYAVTGIAATALPQVLKEIDDKGYIIDNVYSPGNSGPYGDGE